MGKLPDYVKRAQENYRKKHCYLNVRFPAEIKERLYAAGLNAAEVARLVLEELERRESAQKSP